MIDDYLPKCPFYLVKIENYSDMLLSDGRVEFSCTANKKDNEQRFEGLGDIQPQSRDLLELSNGAKHWVSSCGSVSWQVQRPNGSRYLVDTSEGLRVGLTWNVPWTASASCGEGKHNQVTVRTFNNKVRRARCLMIFLV